MKQRKVIIASEEIDIDIVRSSRRTVALYVRSGGTLLIRAPWYVPVHTLLQFVNQKTTWIIRQRERLKGIKPVAVNLKIEDGGSVPYMGREIPVQVRQGTRDLVKIIDCCLLVYVKGNASADKLSAMVDSWYLSEAKRYLPVRSLALAHINSDVLPLPKAVGTRRMKRRWGTCHGNGTIWLNRELIKKEPEVIDYVIIHELCHLVHHDHGRQYYSLLASIIPGYKDIRKKLRQG
jgi:predicted metal-dependent hydrolase